MTRTEKILLLFKSTFGKSPSFTELYAFDGLVNTIPLETISATFTNTFGALYLPTDSSSFVKAAFQTLFGYSDTQMNTIILEQAKIGFQGGVDGFAYWVDQVDNNPFISRDTIYIALLNGSDDATLSTLSTSAASYMDSYSVWLSDKLAQEQTDNDLASITFIGTSGDDRIEVDNKIEKIYSLAGNDTIITSQIDTYVDSGSGNDTIYSKIGNDIIYSGDGNDYIYSEAGNDTIYSGNGDDIIYSGDGDDIIYSEAGDDIIYSGNGNNKIYSGIGDDKIYLGTGNNKVESGDGNDYISGNSGNDEINAGSGNDIIYGEAGADIILGMAGDDTIYAGDDDDIVYGNIGNDKLYGGSGDDIIYGEEGNDYIDSGAGKDILFGGAGIDTFVFNSGDNNATSIDIIKDFDTNEDILVLKNSIGIMTINDKSEYNSSLTLEENIDLLCAADSSTDSSISWFQHDGYTYILQDISAASTFTDGSDIIVSLQGIVDITDINLQF
jgi:Ca2+-binding RTX toxin-like protein